jgi:hypothetical protein
MNENLLFDVGLPSSTLGLLVLLERFCSFDETSFVCDVLGTMLLNFFQP